MFIQVPSSVSTVMARRGSGGLLTSHALGSASGAASDTIEAPAARSVGDWAPCLARFFCSWVLSSVTIG